MPAIGRFGSRVVPELTQIIEECRAKKQLVQGPHVEAFEAEFAAFLGSGHVRTCSTEYGRMALYFILKALDLPARTEWHSRCDTPKRRARSYPPHSRP